MSYLGFVASACLLAASVVPQTTLAEDGGSSLPQNEFKTLRATFYKSVDGKPGTMSFQITRNAGSGRAIDEFRIFYVAFSVDTKPSFYGDALIKCKDHPNHGACLNPTFEVTATAGQLCNARYPQSAGLQLTCNDEVSSTVRVTTVITWKDKLGNSRTQAELVNLGD